MSVQNGIPCLLDPSSETVRASWLIAVKRRSLLTVVVGGAVGSFDEVAAVTGVGSPIRNIIFFACGESRTRVGLNACHQQHEE